MYRNACELDLEEQNGNQNPFLRLCYEGESWEQGSSVKQSSEGLLSQPQIDESVAETEGLKHQNLIRKEQDMENLKQKVTIGVWWFYLSTYSVTILKER